MTCSNDLLKEASALHSKLIGHKTINFNWYAIARLGRIQQKSERRVMRRLQKAMESFDASVPPGESSMLFSTRYRP